MKEKILVVGAGLCGSLLSLRLAQKGYSVKLIEKRPDMRKSVIEAGRSINLALSNRGLEALRLVGLEEEAKQLCTPMHGRMIHLKNGEKRFSKYSGRKSDYINSISREDLNILLLNAADKYKDVEVVFDAQCVSADLEGGTANFTNTVSGDSFEERADVIIGTDGAGSVIRRAYMSKTTKYLFNFSQHFLRTGYKELSIPAGPNGTHQIENTALHIWPRESFMVIALPNLDGSFTVTLFWPFKGENGFDQLNNWAEVKSFFEEEFSDLLPHLPNLEKEYFENPTGTLGTIKCWPWTVEDRFLLMGDAAHAIVPFYGQGMNASFEDVTIMDHIHDIHKGDWKKILSAFSEKRKPDADAIADLALDNFYEMQDHVADPTFIEKRNLEMRLEQTYEDYYSKYSLVTFREDLGYEAAMTQGREQDEILLDLCESGEVNDLDINEIYLIATGQSV